MGPANRQIQVRGAREHSLKNLHVDIPRDKLVVITGLSGSGKSSLAYDTIYAEGQRRYVESLSSYARHFLEQLHKPDVDVIEGLPPTIAISQRQHHPTPRSTVATTTEIYDYLRLLFTRVGTAQCPQCGDLLAQRSRKELVDQLLAGKPGKRFAILASVPVTTSAKTVRHVQSLGYVRVRLGGQLRDLSTVSAAELADETVEVVVDRLSVNETQRARIGESLEAALNLGDGVAVAAFETPAVNAQNRVEKVFVDQVLSDRFGCARCRTQLPDLRPRLFSFNTPEGACPQCKGLGSQPEFDVDLVIPDPRLSFSQGAVAAWCRGSRKLTSKYERLVKNLAQEFDLNIDIPFRNLPKAKQRLVLWGTTASQIELHSSFFEGVIPGLRTRYAKTDSTQVKNRLHAFMTDKPCSGCHGARLRPEALAIKLVSKDGEPMSIAEICGLSIGRALAWCRKLKLTPENQVVADRILAGILHRLEFMLTVGIGYLTLDRPTKTLSGGEAQRIRLATQVGSGLAGICYVLDEPTIGLHQRDNAKLLQTLLDLRDVGNSVLVVEHDEQTIRCADHIIDMGPGAGRHGGEIVAQGTLEQILAAPRSLTASYLKNELDVAVPARRRLPGRRTMRVIGASANNLKAIDVTFPLGCIVCVSGVSGSGKSSLVREILYKALARSLSSAPAAPGAHETIKGIRWIDRAVEIDQSPIGRSPRSTPATFSGVFAAIRSLFASLKEARIRGYDPSRFSFNVKGGRCEACQGQGVKNIEMHFLPDVHVLCEICGGSKYSSEVLAVRLRGLSIANVLELTIEEARKFFRRHPRIAKPLRMLESVGLGYLKLGQASTTLSGGEAQRLKLASELSRTGAGHTLYVLDEPTTGLHFADVSRLMSVLQSLAEQDNTLVIIEHNLDVLKCADWLIDLGPEGGDQGGYLVCQGTPEEVAACEESHTGRFLRDILAKVSQASPS